MKKISAILLILAISVAAFFNKTAWGASKVAPGDTKAIACFLENKGSGNREEVDRAAFTGIGGLWMIDDNCQKTARKHAKQKNIDNWRYLCCPITNDDQVHCEAALGSHGRWR